MKAIYETGTMTQELEVTDFYQDVSKLLAEEDLSDRDRRTIPQQREPS